jgi:hypothetical protein
MNQTATQPAPTGIQTISEMADYPRCITDRWGEWNITGPWSDAQPSSVDPRSFMGSNETTFVALKDDGTIGILSEIETNFYLVPDSVNEDYDRCCFSIEGYVEIKKKLAVDLAALKIEWSAASASYWTVEGDSRVLMEHDLAGASFSVLMPDGYNGHRIRMSAEPVEVDRDGYLVKLKCAEPGKEFMIGWFRLSEFEKAERIVDTNAADLAAAVEPAEAPTPTP